MTDWQREAGKRRYIDLCRYSIWMLNYYKIFKYYLWRIFFMFHWLGGAVIKAPDCCGDDRDFDSRIEQTNKKTLVLRQQEF